MLVIGCSKEESKSEPSKNNPQAAQTPNSPGSVAQAPPTEPVKTAPVTEPAKPRPVVMRGLELAKVLDYTKFEMPEDWVHFGGPANMQVDAKGKIPDVAGHFVKQFTDRGWKTGDGPSDKMITPEYASVKFLKDGHIAHMSCIPMQDKVMVQLISHGNFDTRTMPKTEGATLSYGSQNLSHFVTDTPVLAETEALTKLLMADGWHPMHRFGGGEAKATEEQAFPKFIKQGYRLGLMISKAPAQNNRTSIQVQVLALSHELPIPPKASAVKFDDERWKLQCNSGEPMEKVIAFYEKEMIDAGYVALPGEEPRPTYRNMRFGTPSEDVVMVQVSKNDEASSKVLITGISKRILDKLNSK